MRLRRLELEHFGHFRGQALSFEGEGSFAVVHGHNEAGKTTVLEAIRWLLFGGTGARWAFDGETSQLAVAAHLELASGSPINVRRSNGKGKGLKGLSGTGDEIDEEWILTRLTRPNRAVFENVFGFSLAGLARGADALEHADLKNSIFGGGLGGTVQPGDILDDLERERLSLFKEGGKNQPIHTRGKKVEALTKRVAELTTRAEDWSRLQADLEQRRTAAQGALERLRELRKQEASLRARFQAREPLEKLEAANAELAGLCVPEGIPEDAEVRHASASASLEVLEREARELRDTIDDAEAILAQHVDETLVARRVEIEALGKGLERYLLAERERPLRAGELEHLERRARDRLASLRPGWDLTRLRGFHVDAAARANLEEAIREGENLRTREVNLRATLRALEDELRANDAALAALPGELDVAPLRAWLDAWNELAAQQTVLTTALGDIRNLERKRATLATKMEPPLPGPARDVKAPPEDVIATFERAHDQLLDRGRALATERERLGRELGNLEDLLRTIDPERRAPTEAELTAARARRDSLLEELISALDTPRPDVHTVVRSHDRAVRDADDLADRMRLHADAVQKRAEANLQRARLTEALATNEAARRTLETEVLAHETRWCDAWAPLVPRSPAAMRAWLTTRDQVAALEETLADATARKQKLEAALGAWEERGRALLNRDAPPDELRARARAVVEIEERRASELTTLQRERSRAEPRLQTARADHATLERERDTWSERWPAVLAAVGLERELSRDAARSLISGLSEARTELVHGEQPLREQINRLDEELAAYRARAKELVAGRDLEAEIRTLENALREAVESVRRKKEAHTAHDAASRKLERTLGETRAVLRELEALRSAAGAATDDAFRATLRDRARQRELEREAHAARQLIERLAGDDESFVDAVRALDRDTAVHELAAVEKELETVDARLTTMREDVGRAETRLEAIDGRQDAADALAEAEAERAALRDEIERWSVLTLAETLLAGAIKRFEREHQPGLLARASQVFSSMTDARYTSIRKSRDKLVVERADGRELEPEALSTGTREQLYLAIRLAYVEHYCGNAEPLPIVLDDVLVNFDDERAKATLRALSDFSAVTQVLLFTCHNSTVALAEQAGVEAGMLQIPSRS